MDALPPNEWMIAAAIVGLVLGYFSNHGPLGRQVKFRIGVNVGILLFMMGVVASLLVVGHYGSAALVGALFIACSVVAEMLRRLSLRLMGA